MSLRTELLAVVVVLSTGCGVAPGGTGSSTDALGLATANTLPAPVITSPSDHGTSVGQRLGFVGTSKPGTTVTVYDEAGEAVCTSEATDGTWQCTGGVDKGVHVFDAHATFEAQASPRSNQVEQLILFDEAQLGGGCSALPTEPWVLLGLALFAFRTRR